MSIQLRLKYDQVTLLISRESHNYLTTKPEFDQIDRQLYQSVQSTPYRDDKHLDVCGILPFIYLNDNPTFKEILDYIPYNPEYANVYLYFRSLDYMVGEYHIGALTYQIQTGIWVQDPARPDVTVAQLFTPKIEIKPVLHPFVISDDEMIRRYNQVFPCKVDSPTYPYIGNFPIFMLKKPPHAKLHTKVYTHSSRIIANQSGYRLVDNQIVSPDGKMYAQYMYTIPTFHEYAYYGFFKPTFDEVLTRIPFIPNDRYLVTTNIPTMSVNLLCIGNYHVGFTTVWRIVDENASTSTSTSTTVSTSTSTSVSASATASVSTPKDEYNEDVCMVCMENPPNTMVMPCCHVVVCDQCSYKLTQTLNAKKCVKCQQPIKEVIYPDS